jgi:excisionase family DNA binding protein
MTFSVPDFHYFRTFELPKGPLTPEYFHQIAKNVGICWAKTQENLSRFNDYHAKPPSPAFVKDLLKKRKSKRLGVSEVSALLGISQQTVRRKADRGEIKCKKTEKGTRYFLERDIIPLLNLER